MHAQTSSRLQVGAFAKVHCSVMFLRDKTSEFIKHQDVKGSSRCQVNLACDDEG